MFYGKSNATKIVCEIGDVLRVASEEVLKTVNNGYPYYRGYISIPLEKIPEKNVSDNLQVLDKLSSFQPKRIPVEEIQRIEHSEMNPDTQQEQIADIPMPSSSTEVPSECEVVHSLIEFKEGDVVEFNNKIGTIKKILWQ
jgi:hypothetical protein